MNYLSIAAILSLFVIIGYMFARADNRDMAVCQLSHSEAVCFHTLNR